MRKGSSPVIESNSTNPRITRAIDTDTAPSTGNRRSPEARRGIPLKHRIIGGAVIALLAATGAVIGVNSANNGKVPDKAPAHKAAPIDPTEKQSPTPSATVEAPTGPTIEQLIASHEIKANQTPRALAENIVKEYASWSVYGSDTVATDFIAQVSKTGDGSDAAEAAFIQPIINKGLSIYAPALYGPNYETNLNFKENLPLLTEINRTDLLSAIASGGAEKPYIRGIEINGDSITSTLTSISIDVTTTDNAGVGNKLPISGSVNGVKTTFDILYRVIGDNIEIQKASF